MNAAIAAVSEAGFVGMFSAAIAAGASIAVAVLSNRKRTAEAVDRIIHEMRPNGGASAADATVERIMGQIDERLDPMRTSIIAVGAELAAMNADMAVLRREVTQMKDHAAVTDRAIADLSRGE